MFYYTISNNFWIARILWAFVQWEDAIIVGCIYITGIQMSCVLCTKSYFLFQIYIMEGNLLMLRFHTVYCWILHKHILYKFIIVGQWLFLLFCIFFVMLIFGWKIGFLCLCFYRYLARITLIFFMLYAFHWTCPAFYNLFCYG